MSRTSTCAPAAGAIYDAAAQREMNPTTPQAMRPSDWTTGRKLPSASTSSGSETRLVAAKNATKYARPLNAPPARRASAIAVTNGGQMFAPVRKPSSSGNVPPRPHRFTARQKALSCVVSETA